MRRPDFPRASSAMSAFFFCGSIEEPVALASSSRAKPNSSEVHRTHSSHPREVDPEQGQVEQGLGHEVPVADGIEGVVEHRRETEFTGGELRIDGQRRAGQGARAQRGDIGPGNRREEPIHVA